MTPVADVEAEFARAFIRREKRERYLSFIANPRRRAWILDRLAHSLVVDLDPRFMSRVPSGSQSPWTIAALLESRGAPDLCHAVSEDRDLDGRRLDLDEALLAIGGHRAPTVLICVPDRLAFYTGEDACEDYLLERPPPPK